MKQLKFDFMNENSAEYGPGIVEILKRHARSLLSRPGLINWDSLPALPTSGPIRIGFYRGPADESYVTTPAESLSHMFDPMPSRPNTLTSRVLEYVAEHPYAPVSDIVHSIPNGKWCSVSSILYRWFNKGWLQRQASGPRGGFTYAIR